MYDKANDARIERVNKAFGIHLVPGAWVEATCPRCHSKLSLILNAPGHIGVRCNEKCTKEKILRAVGLEPTDLNRIRKRRTRKAGALTLTPDTKARVANELLAAGLHDQGLPPPKPLVLKIFSLLTGQCGTTKDAETGTVVPFPLETFTTTAAELSEMLGLTKDLEYAEIKEALHGCVSWIMLAEDMNKGVVRGVPLFDSKACLIHTKEKEKKRITLRLNDDALPYLGGVHGLPYTAFNVAAVMRLRSSYTILLFMFLSQFANGKWKGDRFGISLFDLYRRLLIPLNSPLRKHYWRLEQVVLQRAKEEMAKVGLHFDYKPIRAGTAKIGAVLAVEFTNVRVVP